MTLPLLFTFDGQARSGKGTIVHAVKRFLQSREIKTMLIDSGQVFRVLVVSAVQHGVDVDSLEDIDVFLADNEMLEETVTLVKSIYHMSHADRDAMLYTNEISAKSAKFGARPLAQEFKDNLLRKWLHDAAVDGYQVVLLDGRALQEVGGMLENEGLCDYRVGFYFTCDAQVGARRTLGYFDRHYDELGDDEKRQVDELVEQINERNRADSERKVHPIVEPADAPRFALPDFDFMPASDDLHMVVVDTSADLTKEQMTEPVSDLFKRLFDIEK